MTDNQKAALESAIDKLKGYWESGELSALLADGGKDSLTEVVEHTIETIGRQLALIEERAPGNYLDKMPVIRSLTAHKKRLEAAISKETK